MSWQHVIQCTECGTVGEYVLSTLPHVCKECGHNEFNIGIGRKFGPKHWEIQPQRFDKKVIDSPNAIHVNAKGEHKEVHDLHISHEKGYRLIKRQ